MSSLKAERAKARIQFIVAKDGLHILLHVFGSSCDSIRLEQYNSITEPIIVAIDFENTRAFHRDLTPDTHFSVGLAILDTRDLLKRQSIAPSEIISSFNFICGSSEYYRKACLSFLFGVPVKIQQGDTISTINSSILQGSATSDIESSIPQQNEQRNIILVGHAVMVDLLILSKLGFDFRQVSTCLDSSKVCAQVLPYFLLSLKELLDEVQCPYKQLHNGGNDANFTLRALLLLIVRSIRSDKQDHHHHHHDESMVDYLEAIGLSSLPDQPPGKDYLAMDKPANVESLAGHDSA